METGERRQALALGIMLLVVVAIGVALVAVTESEIGRNGAGTVAEPVFGSVLLLAGAYLARYRRVLSQWTGRMVEQSPLERVIVGPERYHPYGIFATGVVFMAVGVWLWVEALT